jgi:branched-chain amino acid transport system substrate-binding protein
MSNLSVARTIAAGPLLSRRRLLANAVALAAAAGSSRVLAQPDEPIRLGQSVALTGPLAELGKVMHTGAKVCFEAVNARGGMNGRRIELIERDDGYDVKRSQEDIKAFLHEPNLFGLFGIMGTPMIEATLPLLRNTERTTPSARRCWSPPRRRCVAIR